MEDRGQGQPPFDERAALEELERVRQQIERYRAQRKELGEEFEQFVNSFKTPREESVTSSTPVPERALLTPIRPPTETSPGPVSPVVPVAARAAESVTARVPPTPMPAEAARPTTADLEWMPVAAPRKPAPQTSERAIDQVTPAIEPPEPAPEQVSSGIPFVEPAQVRPDIESPEPGRPLDEAALSAAPAAASQAPPRTGSRRGPLVGGAVVLLVLGAYAAWTLRPPPAPRSSAPAPVSTPVTPAAPAVEPEVSAPAAPAPAQIELTTTEPVWVRVTADGDVVLARELPANARVPLAAAQTLVIRAGNAGAVRVIIAGQDQGLLGRAGQPATRTFTMPGGETR